MDLKETDILGDSISRHWYYRSKARAMINALDGFEPDSILDIGAGSGFFAKYLLQYTKATEAWCVDTKYDTDKDTHAHGKPVHFRRALEGVDADLVLLMDVMEHVEDDVTLLVDSVRQAAVGARVLITVPAFNFLWSGHDEYLGHYRRYTRTTLARTVSRSGLRARRLEYYFGAILPIALATRIAQKILRPSAQPRSQLRRHHPVVNDALFALCRLELPLMRYNRIAGLSVVCHAEK